ncbi:LacI family DNA-binding transcriptional regulator, partial [Pluralibacter gergoviae]|nr:LacI family DNA-binding transcriptional regulator [Pluralibacter gergoviae]
MKRKSFAAVTSQQVAQLAGVSQSAVSRSFTPGASISPATREKVLKAA